MSSYMLQKLISMSKKWVECFFSMNKIVSFRPRRSDLLIHGDELLRNGYFSNHRLSSLCGNANQLCIWVQSLQFTGLWYYAVYVSFSRASRGVHIWLESNAVYDRIAQKFFIGNFYHTFVTLIWESPHKKHVHFTYRLPTLIWQKFASKWRKIWYLIQYR